ncbi:MAG TPA: sulfurtransferase TusA family protein [Gammaproteobacteria bacterium]|nr:sulfurtransferase TusA family protein [Gammaproteobacteria bacterium]
MNVATEKLDARGLNCPLPILRTRKALNALASGTLLEVVTTDPGAVKDMSAFCTQTGNRLVSSTEADNSFIFLIEKA